MAPAAAPRRCGVLAAALTVAAPAQASVLDVLFMADIGHSREDADDLTSPWPMGKCAYEGAFSLYDGLRDYVERQGARPDAVVISGDVAYGGGSVSVLNATRNAFQRYLMGVVPEDKVFPVIGNHDIHFLGCSFAEERPWSVPCYYGSRHFFDWKSVPDLNYTEWQANWIEFFPGLQQHAAAPPGLGTPPRQWAAPTRYNVDLKTESRVYMIMGLISGSSQWDRTPDTPVEAMDVVRHPSTDLRCEFLRDSLARGKTLGKSIFIYFTHDFAAACTDWELMSLVDVWIVGHKHNYWQNMRPQSTIKQETRHYPARILIGNGGFDEGRIDVVSFGHMQEEHYLDEALTRRVRIKFMIKDTCISTETCPSGYLPYSEHCWSRCQDFPGGYDSGGGPRKATDSRHSFGFTFDAPAEPSTAPPQAPYSGTWKLRMGTENGTRWFGIKKISKNIVLVPVLAETEAANMSFYDAQATMDGVGSVSARLAISDDHRSPVVLATDGFSLERGISFWKDEHAGGGGLVTQDGYLFKFSSAGQGALQMHDLACGVVNGKEQLVVAQGQSLDLEFVAVPAAAEPVAEAGREEAEVIV